jgi:K+-transporting ATPase ATPase A chain
MLFLLQTIVFLAQATFLGFLLSRMLIGLFPALSLASATSPSFFFLKLDRIAQFIFPKKFFGSLTNQGNQTWTQYARSLVILSFVGATACYIVLRLQGHLPANPQGLPGITPDLSFNIVTSFITGTNWQSYTPETSLSYFAQTIGLTVQNFLAPAIGFCAVMPLIRSLAPKTPTLAENQKTAPNAADNRDNRDIQNGSDGTSLPLGNFWYDFSRISLFILLPLAILISLFQLQQGSPQNFLPYSEITTLEGGKQTIAQGPVASQIAIKLIGNNGGGFFGANSCHPYENPTALINWIQMLCMIVLPLAVLFYYQHILQNKPHARSILAIMFGLIFISLGFVTYAQNTGLQASHLSHVALEGTELRFNKFAQIMYSVLTTNTSTGSTNLAFDSLHPLSSLSMMFNLALGSIGLGGIGIGLGTMILYVILTIFLAGLLIGKTPEYLGRRIQKTEVQYTVIVLILTTFCGLILPAFVLQFANDLKIANPAPHDFSAILYMFLSACANNGTSFNGASYNTPFFNCLLGITFIIGRFGTIIPLLALSGSLCKKHLVAQGEENFPTSGPLFCLMVGVISILVVALSFVPAFCVGPIAELFSLVPKSS